MDTANIPGAFAETPINDSLLDSTAPFDDDFARDKHLEYPVGKDRPEDGNRCANAGDVDFQCGQDERTRAGPRDVEGR